MKNLDPKEVGEKINDTSKMIAGVLEINTKEQALNSKNSDNEIQDCWRRVEDELPERNEVVLVCFKSGLDDSLIRAMAYGIYNSEKWQWSTDLVYEEPDWYDRDDIEVTHWMPLPGVPLE